MNAERMIQWLLALYPPEWRARYGDELATLISDMGDHASWRMRLDLAAVGLRERARATLGPRRRDADQRVRSGVGLVLWAWAAFIPAGVLVQKTSEHWQKATPGGHRGATAAFDALTITAVLVSVLILLAIAMAAPALRDARREGAWITLRRRVRIAAAFTAVLALTTVGLVAWAHGLTAAQRDGTDGNYAAGFVVWAVSGVAALAAWTAVATRATAVVDLGSVIRRLHARLALLVAIGVVTMTTATIVWYVLVAAHAPAALTGGGDDGSAPALVGRLIAAMAVMVLASAASTAGARRASFAARSRVTE